MGWEVSNIQYNVANNELLQQQKESTMGHRGSAVEMLLLNDVAGAEFSECFDLSLLYTL